MRRHDVRGTVPSIILAGVCILGGIAVGGAQPATVVREGTINGAGGDGITVSGAGGGPTSVKITATTFVISRQKVSVDNIRPGDYVGVDAKRGADGTLIAVSINILPPEYKGRFRLGQSPMASGDVMTNAQVMEYAVKVENRMLFLKYLDGAEAIAVPPTADVHRATVIRPNDLRAGMHVTVRGVANPDGSVTASSIIIDQP